MSWGLTRARLDRWIERELTEGLSPRRRARLHERLRRDPQARARYDRAVEALRVLEGDRPFAAFELDLVERWLGDTAMPSAAPERSGARRWGPALGAALLVALVMLWVNPLRDLPAFRPWASGLDDGWRAKGPGATGGLALEVLCGPDPGDGSDPELHVRDCSLGDVLGFAYRVSERSGGQLSLFGVDADGDPMYYVPTPAETDGVAVEVGRWRPLPMGIRLSVNHAAGPLRVYGLVAPSAATPEDVAAWAEQLAPQPAAGLGDPAWTERVDAESLARLCPPSTPCHAAELRLVLRP